MENYTKEEQIRKLCGSENPFKVPEGYFENFTDAMMKQIPNNYKPVKLKITLWDRVKPLVYLAAMFTGMMFCIRYVIGVNEQEENNITNTYDVAITDQEIETIVNYTMMDNYTLYQYLTDAE